MCIYFSTWDFLAVYKGQSLLPHMLIVTKLCDFQVWLLKFSRHFINSKSSVSNTLMLKGFRTCHPKTCLSVYWLLWTKGTWETADAGRALWLTSFYQKAGPNNCNETGTLVAPGRELTRFLSTKHGRQSQSRSWKLKNPIKPPCFLVAQLCPTLCNPMDYSPPDSYGPEEPPGKITGVGCHFPLQLKPFIFE